MSRLCTARLYIFLAKVKNEMGGACSAYGERNCVYRFVVGKPEGKRPLGIPGVDGRIILRWIFRKWGVEVWTGSSWLGMGWGWVVGTRE